MKRIIAVAAAVIIGVVAGRVLVGLAYNCGNTWIVNGADTFGGGCGGAFTTTTISKTSYWKIYWADGYERAVSVTEYGQCARNILTTQCYPEFNSPYWYSNSYGYAEWN